MIGYRSFDAGGVRWRENQGGLFPLSPAKLLDDVTSSAARELLERNGEVFIRWESDFDKVADTSWWHIIKDTPETLENLPKKTRYMIRKANKAYEARPVEVSDIRDQGYSVYVKAYERYETHEPILSEREFWEALDELPVETEWWGVFDRETSELVAFSENYVENDACFYVTMWLEPEAMAKFAGYLLFHEMELHYLQDRKFQYVSDGARSLSHDTNIHDFLISKFNFRKAYARLHVVYKPWLGAAIACAYPFRSLISKVTIGAFKKASILLKQEEIRRACSRVAN